jgi:Ca2+-binding RTX toxin-like protein
MSQDNNRDKHDYHHRHHRHHDSADNHQQPHDNAAYQASVASNDSGNDHHHGESGDDGPNDLHGHGGDDHLNGKGGDDHLKGSGGDDRLNGGSGDDHLNGGSGHDVLFGGSGHDHFEFNSLDDSPAGSGHDAIRDFHHGDKIDLHRIDAEDGPGNQKFHFIGDDSFSNHAGELRYEKQGHSVLVQGDTNGDGTADFEILVQHIQALHRHDFAL